MRDLLRHHLAAPLLCWRPALTIAMCVFLRTKAAAEERHGMRFGEGLCLPSHAALTSTGAQGFRPGKGRRGSEGGGRTRNVAVWLGVGRMLRSGYCMDLKSHLVLSLSPDPGGGVRDRWQRLVGCPQPRRWRTRIG